MRTIIVIGLALLTCIGCARLPSRPTVAVAASYRSGGYIPPTGNGFGNGPVIVPPHVIPPGTSESFGTPFDPGTHAELFAASGSTGGVRVMGTPRPPPRVECELPPCESEPEVTADDLGAVVDVLDETRAEVHALRERLEADPPTDSP